MFIVENSSAMRDSLQSGSGIGVLENIKRHRATVKVIVLFGKPFQFMQLHKILRKWAHTGRLENKFRPSIRLNALQVAGG